MRPAQYTEMSPFLQCDLKVADHDVPYYLKVDIKGSDLLCVRALHWFDSRSRYIFAEAQVSASRAAYAALFGELAELWALGYPRFKFVDQSRNADQT